jgi:hypothetical protein
MALWVCNRCGCKFAVGLSMCPQCTGTSVHEDTGEDMAKSTVHGGTSDKRTEDDGWDGSNSPASTATPPTSTPTNEPGDQSTAPTTEPPSSKDQTGDSSAPSTDGESPEVAPYSEWLNEDLSAECETRGLAKTGTKAEMVERLEAYDVEHAGDDGED